MDGRILGQILVAQNVLFGLPDVLRIAEFCAQILVTVPGIPACRVCLGGKSVVGGEMGTGVCPKCKTLRHLAWEHDTSLPANPGFQCNLADRPGIHVLPIESFQHRFGFFVLEVDRVGKSEQYQPFIYNLSNYVALILENRWQKNLLQKAYDDLERKVEERTRALTAANHALAESRRIALDSMKKANDAREHAEQASAHLQREIIERKLADEQIRKLNQALEQRVADRTAQLRAVNRELEAFAYSVSHDLHAPLRHIEGFLGIIRRNTETALDEKNRHYMDVIAKSVRKMGRLIDDLLSFSRMGRKALLLRNVALGGLVREVIQDLEPDAAGRNIDWCIDNLPPVTGDASMLRMVLTNLISNALKYSQPREKARIEIGSLPSQNDETVIFVRDNGVGFNMAYVDKLFGVFQRLHSAEEFEGTGIGLANVQRIIARHGGRTWAEGKPGQGAAFFFSLPKKAQDLSGRGAAPISVRK